MDTATTRPEKFQRKTDENNDEHNNKSFYLIVKKGEKYKKLPI